jgi:hypothetical protein
MKAFYFWNRHLLRHLARTSASVPVPLPVIPIPTSASLIASLKSQLVALQDELHLQSQSNTLFSQLSAERALNRELIAINIDIQNKTIHLENKLLEVIQIPPQERKQLVCDVLIERENEIIKFRRENRTLKEQIRRLEEILKDDPKEVRGRKRGGKGSRSHRPGEGEEEEGDGEDDEELGHGQNSLFVSPELNKKEAMRIIVKELRRLQGDNEELKADKRRLGSQLCDENSRFQQQTLALQVLQQKSINAEKKFQKFVELLVERHDEREVYGLIDELENG